jgi:hypothetical protein
LRATGAFCLGGLRSNSFPSSWTIENVSLPLSLSSSPKNVWKLNYAWLKRIFCRGSTALYQNHYLVLYNQKFTISSSKRSLWLGGLGSDSFPSSWAIENISSPSSLSSLSKNLWKLNYTHGLRKYFSVMPNNIFV